ncbi:MAG TPA: group 1 truncated hemoglobin [Afifellaceae bacterium]|nr:group 1 truncated hemoglobin [Afifellaceae bacterium]
MGSSLFDRFGGQAAVARLVFALYDRVLRSDRLVPYFRDVEMRRLVEHQAKFVSQIMGGPLSYSEGEFAQVHAHLDIGGGDFDEMMRLLEETLREFAFSDKDLQAVMTGVRSHRPWVVTSERSAPAPAAEPMPTDR